MDPRISPIIPTSPEAVRRLQQEAAAERAIQVESEADLAEYFETAAFNPLRQAQRFRSLKDIETGEVEQPEVEEGEEEVLEVTKIEAASERFEKQNGELNARALKALREGLKNGDNVLGKVEAFYKDPTLMDEALDFLLETTDGQLLLATQEAKDKLNKDRGREIKAGKNMGKQALEYAKQGLGTPEELRNLYRQITGEQKETLVLFKELTERFAFEPLKIALNFFLHSLGADMKAKGPSIERGELLRLVDTVRSLQGILGMYRFYLARAPLIHKEYEANGLVQPKTVTFETLSQITANLLAERFLSREKILKMASLLGKELQAQLIIITQMRDAMRQISPRYFRDQKHKDEVMQAIYDTLEDLEAEIEGKDV